ncbi:SMP-30/gluconolactonase/LRE family protein [Rhodococcus sp. HNM0569]|nr:SMP-30/gluconolactonase/LRE family protein [Rhodococcus sp. HNM0569]
MATAFSLVACSDSDASEAAPDTRTAERVLQVTDVHPETGMTLLEGPTFGDDGRLYLVDVTAPAGDAKVMAVDLDTDRVEQVFTDDAGAFTSAQFSAHDGRLYLTDFRGRIVSVAPDGTDPRVFADGEIDGRRMQLDDLTFDDDGNLYATDSSYTAYPEGTPTGRVLRFDRATAHATVLADGQPNPNGISFDRDGGALWVSQLDANRIDYLTLGPDRTTVARAHTAMHVDGGTTQTDSNAVDADGNVYQGIHGEPRILVYRPDGERLATVEFPDAQGLESATNIAIRPGTTDAYVTVSGPEGGYVYRFDAFAEGIRQSNGG